MLVLEPRSDLRQPALELRDGVAQAPAHLVAVRDGEDLADDRAQRVVLIAAHVAAQVAEEVHVSRRRQCAKSWRPICRS
jgi:hypothetical protein